MAQTFAFAAAHRPLAALESTGLEDLFRFWRGVSGRRYVCTVYPVDAPPAFDGARAVVLAVRKSGDGAEIAFVFRPGPHSGDEDFLVWARKARQCGASEWHVHLLANTSAARDFAAHDLAPNGSICGGLRLAA